MLDYFRNHRILRYSKFIENLCDGYVLQSPVIAKKIVFLVATKKRQNDCELSKNTTNANNTWQAGTPRQLQNLTWTQCISPQQKCKHLFTVHFFNSPSTNKYGAQLNKLCSLFWLTRSTLCNFFLSISILNFIRNALI